MRLEKEVRIHFVLGFEMYWVHIESINDFFELKNKKISLFSFESLNNG